MARFRPMNAKEKAMEKGPCVNFPNDQTIVLTPSAVSFFLLLFSLIPIIPGFWEFVALGL